MSDPLTAIEDALEKAGRACLRLIVTSSLSVEQSRQLSKWMFGCMNQRFTIRERVKKHGPGELAKVLKFLGEAWKDVERFKKDAEEKDT